MDRELQNPFQLILLILKELTRRPRRTLSRRSDERICPQNTVLAHLFGYGLEYEYSRIPSTATRRRERFRRCESDRERKGRQRRRSSYHDCRMQMRQV